MGAGKTGKAWGAVHRPPKKVYNDETSENRDSGFEDVNRQRGYFIVTGRLAASTCSKVMFGS